MEQKTRIKMGKADTSFALMDFNLDDETTKPCIRLGVDVGNAELMVVFDSWRQLIHLREEVDMLLAREVDLVGKEISKFRP